MARAPSGDVGADCDYVIVGSGAGGGTLAARLAEAGCEVVLLEAGGDPRQAGQSRLPDDYDVPAFHTFASENPAIGWNFFVHHYGEEKRQRLDPKYRAQWNGRDVGGIFYPRAATLGGCTAHNAMIFVYPHNADWAGIAALTGDESWSAGNMWRYVARLENCHHRPFWRWLRWLGLDSTGHGWSGWLHTEKAIPREALRDERLMRTLLSSALTILGQSDRPLLRLRWMLLGGTDPNDARLIRENAEGVCYTPLSTHHHRRIGARERVLDVARRYPQRLRIKLHALATRVLFDDGHRAVGIEYLKGEHLYRADARPDPASGEKREVRARREVILAGGAFNTPQLLMLSGIGPRATLQRHGIPVRVDRSGVGQNLQDRYEISVVNRMAFPHWRALAGARFAVDDPLFERWANSTSGMYTSNGAVLSLRLRSEPARSQPDLFLMALMSRFEGYFPGYSRLLPDSLNYLTWVVLKAHTNNCAGEVTLRSADPRDPPLVNFCYFDEGSDTAAHDLRAVVGAIRFVRKVAAPLRRFGWIAEETFPGQHLQSDDELAEVVRNQAWGHHAACSCAIGPMERNGVLDSAFRVHGVQGLRVVDASAFPQLPGLLPGQRGLHDRRKGRRRDPCRRAAPVANRVSATMALKWLHDLLVRLLHLERRFDPFFRPLLDALVREPLAGLAQSLINRKRPTEALQMAQETIEPDEEACIAAIIEAMGTYMRTHYQRGGFERAGNTKTHGIVRGRFVVEADLPPHLRRGLFAEAREYPAWVRFAGPGPDSPPDIEDVGVLSIGIKVMGVPGPKLLADESNTQDFTGISTPTFTTPNVRENVKLQQLINRGVPLFYFINPRDSHLLDGIMQGLWARTQSSPLETPYWSCVPYLLGEEQAMQYSLRPRSAGRSQVPRLPLRPPDHYLRETMARTLAVQDAAFDFRIQLQTDPRRMPIECASVRWPKKLSPPLKVATVFLPRQVFDSPAQLAFANRLSFNPWHCLPEHRPLGSQNRARRTIYSELSRLRQSMNSTPHYEPTGSETFD